MINRLKMLKTDVVFFNNDANFNWNRMYYIEILSYCDTLYKCSPTLSGVTCTRSNLLLF